MNSRCACGTVKKAGSPVCGNCWRQAPATLTSRYARTRSKAERSVLEERLRVFAEGRRKHAPA